MGEGILANPVLSDSDRERETLFLQYMQNLYGYNPSFLNTIPSYVEAEKKLAPAPKPAQPQGLESLLKNIGIDSSYINMYTQPRFFETNSGNDGGLQDGKELGEQYANKGRPSFLGFTGDLSAQTGRTIRDNAPGGNYDIQRPETYRDVLNAYNRSQYFQD